jgi:CRP/FNR family transcriptional regulator, cyclic AMP receptor protein
MDFFAAIQTVQTLNAEDAFHAKLSPDQWRAVAPFFTRHEIRSGDLMIKQGDTDRTLYILGQGSLQVFVDGGAASGMRAAILRSGSVLGESALFGDAPRTANAEAMTPCIVFALRAPRLEELSQRLPALAIELFRAAGGLMLTRVRAQMSRQIPFC